jgi:hypothetical protein
MTQEQDQALRDYLRESIIPLIEQVLVKKLGQAMTFAAEELIQPKRQWVGLTEEEMQQTCYEAFSYDPYVIARAIEAKLKEKNGGHI